MVSLFSEFKKQKEEKRKTVSELNWSPTGKKQDRIEDWKQKDPEKHKRKDLITRDIHVHYETLMASRNRGCWFSSDLLVTGLCAENSSEITNFWV